MRLRGVLRIGARHPSGRPGARWLRVDREPLSTERPGPTRVTPAGPVERSLASAARALDLAPSGSAPVRHTTTHGPAAFDGCVEILRSDVLWWTRPNLPADGRVLSIAV
ncbi:hypothetical protein GCM10009837_00490 [Streptomyces durmitorensis]